MALDTDPRDGGRGPRFSKDSEPRWKPIREPELERALEEMLAQAPEPSPRPAWEMEPEPDPAPEPEAQSASPLERELGGEMQSSTSPGNEPPLVERRRCGRARIALCARVRPAVFADSFEHVVTTLNASRNGLCFQAPGGCYRDGLRLHIAAPFQGVRGALNLDVEAEVVRVRPLDGGCVYVAVQYLRDFSLKQALEKRFSFSYSVPTLRF